jgi:hypothetical protein
LTVMASQLAMPQSMIGLMLYKGVICAFNQTSI